MASKIVSTNATFRLNVTNIAEVSGAFKQVDVRLPKELQKRLKKVADHVVGVAQQRMPFGNGDAAKSLKPRATGRGSASILFPAGGPESFSDPVGYYPWLDFGGGKAGARGITSSSPIAHARSTGGFKRPYIKGGRFLYPAIAESQVFISDAVDDAIETLAKEAGFDTEGHV